MFGVFTVVVFSDATVGGTRKRYFILHFRIGICVMNVMTSVLKSGYLFLFTYQNQKKKKKKKKKR